MKAHSQHTCKFTMLFFIRLCKKTHSSRTSLFCTNLSCAKRHDSHSRHAQYRAKLHQQTLCGADHYKKHIHELKPSEVLSTEGKLSARVRDAQAKDAGTQQKEVHEEQMACLGALAGGDAASNVVLQETLRQLRGSGQAVDNLEAVQAEVHADQRCQIAFRCLGCQQLHNHLQ